MVCHVRSEPPEHRGSGRRMSCGLNARASSPAYANTRSKSTPTVCLPPFRATPLTAPSPAPAVGRPTPGRRYLIGVAQAVKIHTGRRHIPRTGTAQARCTSGCRRPTWANLFNKPPTSVVLPAPRSPERVISSESCAGDATAPARFARRVRASGRRPAPAARRASATSRRRRRCSITSLASSPRSPRCQRRDRRRGDCTNTPARRCKGEIAALRRDAGDDAREHVTHARCGHVRIAAIAQPAGGVFVLHDGTRTVEHDQAPVTGLQFTS